MFSISYIDLSLIAQAKSSQRKPSLKLKGFQPVENSKHFVIKKYCIFVFGVL